MRGFFVMAQRMKVESGGRACLFPKTTFTVVPTRLSAKKRGNLESIVYPSQPVEGDAQMDQTLEQVVEIKEEVVELTLAELAEVGGGAVVACF
jgi:hypothetical protein